MSRPPYVSFAVRSGRPGQRLAAHDLVTAVIDEIRGGRLPAGSRLPPVRALEQQLGLSKNTAQSAYDELVARGVLDAREREGIFVAARPEVAPPRPLPITPPLPRLRPAPPLHARVPKGSLALSTVFIDPQLLPRERLADCIRSVLKTPGLEPYYDFQGHPPLREAIAARLRARGMDVQASQVLITTGSQQAIDLVARALDAKRVVTENPVYSHAKMLFESHGASVTGLTLDPFRGPALDEWERQIALARPALFYAITSFQNPTGYSYTTHELTELLRLAAKYDFALLEDDWGSDMLSGSEYRPTLRALGGPNVVYVNSFTKKLLPSLRMGFLVAHDDVMPSLIAMKRLSVLGNAWVLEAALAEFLDRGYYDTHLASLHRELDARYEHCLEALQSLMPEGVSWTSPGGGPTLWLEVPRGVDLDALDVGLQARGVHIEDPRAAFFGRPHLHGFRISYASLPAEALRRGLSVLAEELKRVL